MAAWQLAGPAGARSPQALYDYLARNRERRGVPTTKASGSTRTTFRWWLASHQPSKPSRSIIRTTTRKPWLLCR